MNARYEPVISIPLQGPSGLAQEIEAVVDTGYNGYITLPPGLVAELGLTLQSEGWAMLANGSVETFDIYGVTMLWGGQPRHVDADAVGPTPLAGMLLLDRHDLSIQVREGGRVESGAVGVLS